MSKLVSKMTSEEHELHKAHQRERNRNRSPEKREERRAQTRAWRAQHKDETRNIYFKWRGYGITSEDYINMLARQGGGCAICGQIAEQEGKSLAVDHRHEDGIIRGLLCQNCNQALGKFKDSIVLLRKAATYLAAK